MQSIFHTWLGHHIFSVILHFFAFLANQSIPHTGPARHIFSGVQRLALAVPFASLLGWIALVNATYPAHLVLVFLMHS